MKNLFVLIGLFCIAYCTKKPKGDDLSGLLELKGTVYLNDTIRGYPEEIVQKGLAVQIRKIEDSATPNFLYSTVTDDLGNFTFTNLSAQSYLVVAEKEVGGVLYSSRQPVTPQEINAPTKLVLYPDVRKYNLLTVVVRDSATKGPLFNAKVCLFSNSFLARNNECDGAISTKQTNEFGRVQFSRLDAGWHFINAQLSSGNVNIKIKDSIQILNKTGYYYKEVYLK